MIHYLKWPFATGVLLGMTAGMWLVHWIDLMTRCQ